MKKILLAIVILAMVSPVFAQEFTQEELKKWVIVEEYFCFDPNSGVPPHYHAIISNPDKQHPIQILSILYVEMAEENVVVDTIIVMYKYIENGIEFVYLYDFEKKAFYRFESPNQKSA